MKKISGKAAVVKDGQRRKLPKGLRRR